MLFTDRHALQMDMAGFYRDTSSAHGYMYHYKHALHTQTRVPFPHTRTGTEVRTDRPALLSVLLADPPGVSAVIVPLHLDRRADQSPSSRELCVPLPLPRHARGALCPSCSRSPSSALSPIGVYSSDPGDFCGVLSNENDLCPVKTNPIHPAVWLTDGQKASPWVTSAISSLSASPWQQRYTQ